MKNTGPAQADRCARDSVSRSWGRVAELTSPLAFHEARRAALTLRPHTGTLRYIHPGTQPDSVPDAAAASGAHCCVVRVRSRCQSILYTPSPRR
eukprot:5863259-Prymnesium_polylepis.1